MKKISRFYLCAVLGLGVMVHEVNAFSPLAYFWPETTNNSTKAHDLDNKIHATVEQHLKNAKDLESLKASLKALQPALLGVVSNSDHPQHKELKSALSSLNIDSLSNEVMKLRTIIANLPNQTKEAVSQKLKDLPLYIKYLLGV